MYKIKTVGEKNQESAAVMTDDQSEKERSHKKTEGVKSLRNIRQRMGG